MTHVVHSFVERWLALLQGYRTLIFLGLVTYWLTQYIVRLPAEHFVGVAPYLPALYTVLILAYPVSKAASGLRDRWRSAGPVDAHDRYDPDPSWYDYDEE